LRCSPAELDGHLARIRLAAFDADGVLTDGRFVLLADGRDGMSFSTRDGLGLHLLMAEGVAVAVISGRTSDALSRRAELLGISRIVRGSKDKAEDLRGLAEAEGIPLAEALFMGDDLPDLPAMALAGVAAAPADAHPEVLARADLVAKAPGGGGAVREVAERLLRARGRYEAAVARYAEPR
jgi:3-deoxy-D-manno-octulosonate 8-phosphate phosphatase (KDO 8-P phosphatase)